MGVPFLHSGILLREVRYCRASCRHICIRIPIVKALVRTPPQVCGRASCVGSFASLRMTIYRLLSHGGVVAGENAVADWFLVEQEFGGLHAGLAVEPFLHDTVIQEIG